MPSAESVVTDSCTCNIKDICLLNGECRSKSIVYQATVKAEREEKTYVGLRETEFKIRYHNHTASFRNQNKRNATELWKYIWVLKEKKINYALNLARCAAYRKKEKTC